MYNLEPRIIAEDRSIQDFMGEYVLEDEEYCIPVSNAYNVYTKWAKRYNRRRVSRSEFSNLVVQYSSIKRTSGRKNSSVSVLGTFRIDRRTMMFQGIRFKEQDRTVKFTQDPNSSKKSDLISDKDMSKFLENDVLAINTLIFSFDNAWENLDELCSEYRIPEDLRYDGEKINTQYILEILYTKNLTLADVVTYICNPKIRNMVKN